MSDVPPEPPAPGRWARPAVPSDVASRATLGTDVAPNPYARPRSEAVAALGPDARSILVSGVLLLILVLGGLGAIVGGTIGVGRSLSDSQVFEDEAGFSPADVIDCQAERRTVRNAVEVFRSVEQREPTSTAELVPEFLLRSPASYRVVLRGGVAVVEPRPGSACDGDRDREERARTAVDTIEASASIGLLLAGMLALGVSATYQGYWLATAYRCLPSSRQQHRARRAYSPLVVYAIGLTVLGALWASLFASEVVFEEPLTASIAMFVAQVIFLIFLVRAILRAFSMLGDVTFHFCNGHYMTSRLLRISLLGFLVLPAAGVVVGNLTVAADQEAIGVAVVLIAFVLGYLVFPAVGLVAYVVAVLLAISGVERTLNHAARDLTAMEREDADRARHSAAADR